MTEEDAIASEHHAARRPLPLRENYC